MIVSDLRGSCLCGAVKVHAARAPSMVALCHCRVCQKHSGSAFSTVAVFQARDVEVTGAMQAYEGVNDAGDPVRRHFCRTCGTPVMTSSAATAARGVVVLKAPLFDQLRQVGPKVQMFCDSALEWMPDIAGTQRFDRKIG